MGSSRLCGMRTHGVVVIVFESVIAPPFPDAYRLVFARCVCYCVLFIGVALVADSGRSPTGDMSVGALRIVHNRVLVAHDRVCTCVFPGCDDTSHRQSNQEAMAPAIPAPTTPRQLAKCSVGNGMMTDAP
ncbi:MAG: hypothetical protein FWD57_11460 [Polyangiaceae bacterium]|nr:hypothetical protein [Polyangiaceae bacterium]